MNKIELVEKDYLKKTLPEFKVGDHVKVSLKVQEGDKTRTQLFEGIVIRKRGRSTGATFSVLKEVRGELVEKTFPIHSPHVEKVVVTFKGNVKRSKLYNLRKKLIAAK
jgi:large subunit ribosomal protein L19